MDIQYLGILFLSFFCFTSYSLPVSFFPLMAKRFKLSSTWIGFILSTFTMGAICMSLILAKFMKYFGKKRLLSFSIFCLAFTMFMFTILEFIENKSLFLFMSLLSRTLHGVFFGIISSIAYAYVPQLYPDDIKNKTVLLEVAYGSSMSFGAYIGGKLYGFGGPITPFISFALLYLVLVYPILKILPDDSISNNELMETNNEKMELLSYKPLFTSYAFISTILISYNFNCLISYLLSIIPIYLVDLNEQELNSIVFLLITGIYSVASVLIAFFFNIKFKNCLLFGSLILTIGVALIGIDKEIGVSKQNFYFYSGFVLFGIGGGTFFVILIPELILISSNIFQNNDEELIGDMASGLFSSSCFLGEMIGPILGGFLYDLFGFPGATKLMFAQSLLIIINYSYFYTNSKRKEIPLDYVSLN